MITLQRVDFTEVVIILMSLEILIYVFVYTSFWYHVIILLIVLEFIILKNFLVVVLIIYVLKLENVFLFFFRALAVSEASLGISLLTVLSRAHGNDYLRIEINFICSLTNPRSYTQHKSVERNMFRHRTIMT